VMGMLAGRISARFGSRFSLMTGAAVTAAAFAVLIVAHGAPIDFLICAALLGLGIGLSFAALGTLIIGAVPPHQSGVASGMNTVMRTLGGALGGQLSATFLAGHIAHGLPTVTGFEETFVMATAFLVVCVRASLLVPPPHLGPSGPAAADEREPEPVEA
jgi:MFS family permease